MINYGISGMRKSLVSLFGDICREPFSSRMGAATVPEADLAALKRIFGPGATSVKVFANSRYAKLHRALATTRRDRIYLACSLECFVNDPKLMLHEYYHVIAQWNCGELSAGGYLWESLKNGYRRNRYEIAACRFADVHLAEFKRLRGAQLESELPNR